MCPSSLIIVGLLISNYLETEIMKTENEIQKQSIEASTLSFSATQTFLSNMWWCNYDYKELTCTVFEDFF